MKATKVTAGLLMIFSIAPVTAADRFLQDLFSPIEIVKESADNAGPAKLSEDDKRELLAAKRILASFMTEMQRSDQPMRFLTKALRKRLPAKPRLAEALGLEPEEAIMTVQIRSFQISGDRQRVEFDYLVTTTQEGQYNIAEQTIGMVKESASWRISRLPRGN